MCLLLGRSWGLWVMAHLITCSPWTYHRATDHYSNFQLPSILKSIQLYCLPSFYWHQTRTWLLRLIMEFPLIHISDIIPPLYPIVIHLFILVGYPSYRDKNLYLWSPYSTSWNIIILSRVKRPLQGNIGHLCMALLQLGNVKHIMNSWQSFGWLQLVGHFSHMLQNSVWSYKSRANFPLTPNRLTPRREDTWRHALSPIS